jgi:hypothetical protein
MLTVVFPSLSNRMTLLISRKIRKARRNEGSKTKKTLEKSRLLGIRRHERAAGKPPSLAPYISLALCREGVK